MGDAGPAVPPLAGVPAAPGAEQSPRAVSVLVLGFGPFKSFIVNPSYLIALRLPPVLHLQPAKDLGATPPLAITLHVHRSPVTVSYATAATILPRLLAQYNEPDYIFHIGMAAGRDHYALETRARRDGYVIKDVEEKDGKSRGEMRWKELGLPEVLGVGWDGHDVLERWRGELNGGGAESEGWLDEQEKIRASGRIASGNPGGTVKSDLVRLSGDAGKFFCEFILYESLGLRVLEDAEKGSDAVRRKGKVAFLHVPGATDAEGIRRGIRVAEAAVRAVVGSWEAGRRAEGFA